MKHKPTIIYDMLPNSSFYIFDIDWTLLDISHRLHYIKWDIKDWKSFQLEENVNKDEPISNVVNILKELSKNHWIILLTGRKENLLWITETQMNRLWISYDLLIMKNEKDSNWWAEFKRQVYNEYLKDFNILWVFEDLGTVISMWKEEWVFVFNVAQWDDVEY